MKIEIRHLSPHQNAKVFAVIMTLGSLVFMLPFMAISTAMMPSGMQFPWGMLVAMPVAYLVFGYLMTLVACVFYNLMVRFVGGFEFTTETQDT
jgi:hypothetical protein